MQFELKLEVSNFRIFRGFFQSREQCRSRFFKIARDRRSLGLHSEFLLRIVEFRTILVLSNCNKTT